MKLEEALKRNFFTKDYYDPNEIFLIGEKKYNPKRQLTQCLTQGRVRDLKTKAFPYLKYNFIELVLIGATTSGANIWYIQIAKSPKPKQLSIFDLLK